MRRILFIVGLLIACMATSLDAQALKVYYNNPNDWTNVTAYVYKGATNNEWPGAAMTKEGNLWTITVADTYAGGNVIFTDGSDTQYPAATGKEILSGNTIICQDKYDDTKTIVNEYIAAPFKVYFDMTGCTWAKPYVHYWGAQGSEWPGVAMTLKSGSTTVYEYEVPAGTAGLIFTNGAATGTLQTANLKAAANATYNMSGNTGGSQATGEPFYVYFDNSAAKWNPVKIHYWGGTSASAWEACPNMQLVSGNVYRYQVPAGTTGVIFRDTYGSQTVDYTAVADHIYNQSGDQGAYDPSAPVQVETPAALYILGTLGDTFWSTTPGIALTKSGNTFSAEGVVIKPAAAGQTDGYITLVTATGADWDAVNASARYGAATEDAPLAAGTPADVVKTGANAFSWKIAAGTYTISVDFETMKISATQTGSGPVAGTGDLVIPTVKANPGRDATMEIQIGTDKDMAAVQFDITVPAGITAGAPLISRTMADHTLDYATVEGKLRVVVYSESNSTFKAQNGALLYLPLSVAASTAVGDYTVTLSDIVFSDADLLAVNVADVTGTIQVAAASDYEVTLSKKVVALSIGGTETLTATITPDDGTATTWTWSSATPTVATVDNTGQVTAVANGTAVIRAAAKGAYAECTVYVGKLPQTITWSQTIAPLGVGEEDVELVAESSVSTLPVSFRIAGGSAYATIVDGNKLHAVAPGIVTVEAYQEGNDSYAPAESVTKTVTIWLGYIMGDVNEDKSITTADVTATVQHILGNTPANFKLAAADMNGDTKVNVVDVTLIVNEILKASASASAVQQRRIAAADAESFDVTALDNSLRISFSNMDSYVSTMFDIVLPEGVKIIDATMAGSQHKVAYVNGESSSRVVVYSMNNSTFAQDGFIDLLLDNYAGATEILLGNALVDSIVGNEVYESYAIGFEGVPSGISLTGADNFCTVYTVDGLKVFSGNLADFDRAAHHGVFLIRTAGKVQKVSLR